MSNTAREENWMPLLRTFYRMFQEAVELSVVFQRVYELFPPLLNVSRASILLYDPALDALVSGDYIGATQPGEGHLKSEPQPLGHSISGICFLEARPIVIDDVSQSDIIPRDVAQRLAIKSTLAVPIMFGGTPIGVLRVDDREHTHRFDEELVEWVQLLAEQLAIVIQNARLYSSLNQRERDLRRINEELRATRDTAQQMAQAKSGFLARVSHELRTPLNAILGYTELLREEAKNTPRVELDADLAKIEIAATHLMAIINDLLDLSTIEAGKGQVRQGAVQLEKVIQEAIFKSRKNFERRGNSIEVQTPDGATCECNGDPTKLRQVLVTVLSFASRLSNGSKLTLSVTQQGTRDLPLVELMVMQPAIALNSDQLNRLFHTFHDNETASDTSETPVKSDSNKGLGLTIAQHLCRRMGGDLAAFGDPAHGTAFVIRLPGIAQAA
ncbi:MAG: GAF domain-containing protein [Candidatus Sumerlaeaceae bacterium]